MSVIIKFTRIVGGNLSALRPADYENKYVVAADDVEQPSSWVFTADVSRARAFRDLGEAHQFYMRACRNHPLRPDGKPNRPLTAFSVLFLPGPDTEGIILDVTSLYPTCFRQLMGE